MRYFDNNMWIGDDMIGAGGQLAYAGEDASFKGFQGAIEKLPCAKLRSL